MVRCTIGGLVAACLCVGAAAAQAGSESASALFNFTEESGYAPGAGIIAGPDGTLYGTTTLGGTGTCNGGAGCGSVFALTPPAKKGAAWQYEKLYDFQGGSDGAAPSAPLTLGPSGELYGYTAGQTPGSVFRLLPPAGARTAWQFDVIYVFRDRSDGNLLGMHAPLVMNKEEVVGIAAGGKGDCGDGQGCGSVFGLKLQHDGTWSELTIHRFTGTDDSGLPTWITAGGSAAPVAVTTSLGRGAVVALIPPGLRGLKWQMKIIASFRGGQDGEQPTHLVADAKGNFYGIASQPSGGMVFGLAAPGFFGTKWNRSTLAEIDQNGSGPASLAFGDGGVLLGAVSGAGKHDAGGAFQLDPPQRRGDRWQMSMLWDFEQGPGSHPLNVIAGLGASDYGVLAGTGKSTDQGAVFSLSAGQ